MPSPFPGMDPYLEHPEIFPDLHDRLVTNISEFVQQSLPSPYYAAIGRRVWIEFSERFVGPDVNVLRPERESGPGTEAGGGGAAVAVASEAKVVHVPFGLHEDIREPFVEIYTRQGNDKRLVTTIEVISLTNKSSGGHGRDFYLLKQREMLSSQVNLVEIDLLRAGEHATAVPLNRALQVVGPFDYHVCVHYFDKLADYYVYPIQLQNRLPKVAVPLLPGDGAVVLDLQAVFDRCYDTGPYRREVRYLEDTPTPPLQTEQAEWARGVLERAFHKT